MLVYEILPLTIVVIEFHEADSAIANTTNVVFRRIFDF